MSIPEKRIELEMSNFDNVIDSGLEEALQEEFCYAQHSACNFCGYVWWDDVFIEEVWVYNSPVETIVANNLRELMDKVNDKYGWE